MLTYEEALARVLDACPFTGEERVSFFDAAGRVLAADVVARAPQPAFDYSAMDGYAVRSADLAGEVRALMVEGESRTGGDAPPPLAEGTASRIFTGAMIPPGADAVVMQEDVTREGDVARFSRVPRAGDHIRRRGEDVA